MLRSVTCTFVMAVAAAGADPAEAKDRIAQIELTRFPARSTLVISDPKVVSKFNIWNGPGVTASDPRVRNQGMFADWNKGVVARKPNGLQRYRVEFTFEERATPYVVFYEFNPALPGGYVYLPARREPEGIANTALIYHGVEGHWFHSSAAWEELVRPSMESAVVQ
jgi:hypothetical protein